jgi:hypothetical protein
MRLVARAPEETVTWTLRDWVSFARAALGQPFYSERIAPRASLYSLTLIFGPISGAFG